MSNCNFPGSGCKAERTAIRRPSLKINAISNWMPLVSNAIIAFFLTPYLIKQLGDSDFGIYSLVGGFLGYYGLLRLGVGAAIMRYVPFCLGSNDLEGASENTSTGMVIYLLAGIFIFLICLITAEPLAKFYEGGPQFAFLIKIMGLAAAFECPMRIFDSCVRAHEKWVIANCVTVIVAVFRGISFAGCIYLGYGLRSIGVVALGVTILALILAFFMYIFYCPKIHLRLKMVRFSRVRPLLSFGILTTVISLIWSMTLQGHKLLIGKLISVDAVTVYAVAAMIMYNVRALVIAPNRVFWPRFANLDGKDKHQEIKSLFNRATRYNSIFASGIMLMVVVAGPVFIQLWVGEAYEGAYPVLKILAIGYLVETSLATSSCFLGGTGRQGISVIFALVEGVLGFSLSLYLGLKLGLAGVACGFALSVFLIRGLLCPLYICHLLGISYLSFYLTCFARPYLVLLILVFASNWFRLGEVVNGWVSLIVLTFFLGCVYTGCSFFFTINSNERVRIKEKMVGVFYYIKTLSKHQEKKFNRTYLNNKPPLSEQQFVKEN